MMMIIVYYKIRKMLEVITWSPSQVCKAVVGPSLVAWPGWQCLSLWLGCGETLAVASPLLGGTGLAATVWQPGFPGPGFGWSAGSLRSAQELSGHGGVQGEPGQGASRARGSLNGIGKLEGERNPPQLDGKLAESNGK